MRRRNLIIILVIILIAYFGYNFIYQDHRDIKTETPVFSIPAASLAIEFQENPVTAETKFLNKTIEVTGVVTELSSSDLTLDNTTFCNLSKDSNTESINLNDKIIIKGRCIGYDDLLELIKLDQCSIIN